MRKYYLLIALQFFFTSLLSQEKFVFADSVFPTYYHQRLSLFKKMPKKENEIIFIGNSITEGGQWTELFDDFNVLNRGISGDITAGVINRLFEIYSRKPSKVFLLIGINDLAKGITSDSIVKNTLIICKLLHKQSPNTKIFVQSILTVNDQFGKFITHTNKGEAIKKVNSALRDSAYENEYEYIDLYNHFIDEKEKLKANYTNDGLHLLAPAYLKWKELIFNKVYNIPSLIPMPNKVIWTKGSFSLTECSGIVIKDEEQLKDAIYLQKQLNKKGFKFPLVKKQVAGGKYIILRSNKAVLTNGYKLNITEDQILISFSDFDGLFYGIQTLLQLQLNQTIKSCQIEDQPAFNWRGYMIDVGRNYQSISQIFQQIDIMSKYKLNVFHLHLTEDIAWRLYSNKYPILTSKKHMLRNKGKYYSPRDLNKINQYCKTRHIKLVIEVDMPGHSAAFKRALGVDMQSKEGMIICKNILQEICDQINVEYIHIGGDEVAYTNKNFLNEMIALLKKNGKKAIAWNPGGNVKAGTILQLWNGKSLPQKEYPSIDSRHLYINHFDPLEGVVTVFNHKMVDVVIGDSNHLGATLCNWHDRNVKQETDLINMNGVYPIMLTFAERIWKGGGWKNFISDFGKPGSDRYDAFVEYENRLLIHQEKYFKNKPFLYVQQSNVEWNLMGPYDNYGNTLEQFEPEEKTNLFTSTFTKNLTVFGGTIILRHFWDPMIDAHLNNQKHQTTWYASRTIFSPVDTIVSCWIGFNNYSRSTATAPPPNGYWDDKNSKIWVNGIEINPPTWSSAGKQINLETPLIDEGYEYRSPTKVHFKKGNNLVLIKSPVNTFRGKDWQNPIKWMFTFVVNNKF